MYLTTLNPEDFDKAELAKNNYGGAWRKRLADGRLDYYIEVEIPFSDLNLERCDADDRDVYLYSGDLLLSRFKWQSGKNSEWASVVYFTAGSLPLTAILHLRQLSLFSMISRLPSDPLNSHAQHVLLTAIRHLFLQYGLPHPLDILSNPPSKEAFKKLVKSKIIDFWERKLRLTALPLIDRSLCYFDTKFMSLSCPHPLLIAAGKNVDEVSKARIQLKLLVSQYPCGQLTRYWTPDNPDGLCSYPPCYSAGAVETREHLLLHCPAYVDVRLRMLSVCFKLSNPTSHHITVRLLLAGTTNEQMQLLLDSSSIPDVISAVQGVGDSVLGDLMYLGRTWCFAIHRARSKRLGLWKKA